MKYAVFHNSFGYSFTGLTFRCYDNFETDANTIDQSGYFVNLFSIFLHEDRAGRKMKFWNAKRARNTFEV